MSPTQSAASIIIPAYNQIAYTKECLSSLLADPERPSYELIVIDNASHDGTAEYLRDLEQRLRSTHDRLVPVINEKNLGVAPAWNQGLDRASHELVAILNNDIVLTRGWLRGLENALELHGAGLISPFVRCGARDYDLEATASHFTRANAHKFWPDYDFCAVVTTRATIDAIGRFDENFKVGGYEDTDYAYRMRKAGIRYGVSGAAFIHHYGSQTLGEFKKTGDRHVGPNRDYFISKWGVDPSSASATPAAKLRRAWRKIKLRFGRM